MTSSAGLTLISYLILLLPLAWITSYWLTAMATGRLHPAFQPLIYLEQGLYRLAGIKADNGMSWKEYAQALLLFNGLGVLTVYLLQRWQGHLPFNPQEFGAVSADSAFNTAVSFVTNTNWQGYAGETTLSYLVQMLGLTVQNFLSAATGIAVAFALIRGLMAQCSREVGNFWVDVTRLTLYLLLPLSIAFALFLMSQGVIQNILPYQTVSVLDSASTPMTQTLAMGPVASQEAIKILGTNGGGFFNANSAHPFENPTFLSNWMQMLAIFLIPAALCFTFGQLVADWRQGAALLGAMTIIFALMAIVALHAEQQPNPLLANTAVDQLPSVTQAGGNMEGKEVRFGINASALFATITTAASCGAVNAMHDSFMPLGGLITIWLMQLGEVIFGGVGSGLYGMIIFALLAVFIAGLMVGRTPEYLGKKIERFEMKMIALIILITPLLLLGGTALAVSLETARASLSNPGAHGFSQVLYAFSSAANNNGSAFAGLNSNTWFYNISLALAMWFGRFAIIVAVLAIAGSLAAKKKLPITGGTLPTQGGLFVILLISTVLLVGALTYLPVLVLGPIAEHVQLFAVSPAH
jgi:K+-transporting ATPase ATPase A chain